ncbi:MAG: glycine cleavage system protein R [bacterium]
MHYFLVSVFSPDQVGLISAISGTLFDLDINLADTNYTILGEGGQFAGVCETQSTHSAEEIREALQDIDSLQTSTIHVVPFGMAVEHAETANISHRVKMSGADDPGLVARVTEVIHDFQANVVQMNTRLHSQNGERLYTLELALSIPEQREAACLAALQNIASSLGLGFNLNP